METLMLIAQLVVFLGAIFLGIRLGGIAIGYAGGLGVVVLGLVLGMKPGSIPWDVILIIAAAIAAISAMQQAGGLDYMVRITEKILRANPKFINYLAPACGWLLTILAGTGNAVFSLMPVVVDVAKSQNIKPSAPLSLMVVSSQIGITASPVSAAVVYMSGVLEEFGWNYPTLILIWIVTTFIGCMATAFIVGLITNLDLSKDKVYQERLKAGLVKDSGEVLNSVDKPGAKISVAIFLIAVLCVVLYATAISNNVKLIDPVIVKRDEAIMSFLLTAACLITLICKVKPASILETSVFKSGMTACVCVFGVAWLGNTFVAGHQEEIKSMAANWVQQIPALLAVAFFFASMLLYSQAATAKAITPIIITALGISATQPGDSYMLVACFAAVSALFVLPTYPTLLGAVQMDDTGSTRIGNYIFNHPFFIPGILAIAISVALGFVLVPIFA
ncbi:MULTISPECIES: anaerobic C4-dicarboxylate transporter [unclassified Campylobacter]|uniref:anaerobic C4-dicarboxylate transporter n=1 Tax=unclassified Campylobacter TaxID=2593542 RepID=UPI001237FD02|nr:MULTISPECIES: anaerobic C4-dicarboxylate transporter [unclassified Campylobacter]KAA6224618.1 anaerobic C4-dicarboxylate transporter [Campylobacter sp. LR185c]KAA6224860.1 anaerobic C4-dicarboxylate transporter [Campylobacter sp. LR286c]KAA6228007.1 anaerobic C4-dicarboxylate transporter [Campylobacter sp. LR196d]KAA6233488.1 anaerobic C4-dicarboxylate transporter [Campylobacter sp. LR291e]KAA6234425.1 anaerobic C4-dicarboxylate transporter [Campylobacter sp. LR264d]